MESPAKLAPLTRTGAPFWGGFWTDAQCQKDDRRTRKRLATRQSISDTATRLFLERGFDAVTIDDIAEAADLGRMTVFNHFPRKEDMFFDREEEVHQLAFDAIRNRAPGVAPIEATRQFAHDLVAQDHPFVVLSANKSWFIATALKSEALKARGREMRDDFTRGLAQVLAEAGGQQPSDPNAHMAAGLIIATWNVAFAEALKVFEHTHDNAKAMLCFLVLIDRGSAGAKGALAGTAYA